MIVVDVNVIAYLLIKGEKTETARSVYNSDSDWIVPSLWRHELLNILTTYVVHGGGNFSQAQQIWQIANALLDGKERAIASAEALKLAIENRISAYDAQYVLLAQQEAIPLVTEDKKLQKLPDRSIQSMFGGLTQQYSSCQSKSPAEQRLQTDAGKRAV